MSRFALATAFFLASALAAPFAWSAGGPPRGVYGCYDVWMGANMQMQIRPMPFVMFGLVDGTTYSDYDGHRGRYSYDAASGVLTMLDGSRQGWRYRKSAEWAFTLMENGTDKEMYTCPHNADMDPTRGPW